MPTAFDSIRPSGSSGRWWTASRGPGTVLTTAIHDGHTLRPEVSAILALPGADRLREEDSLTGLLADVTPNRLVFHRSRFEIDVNRPREKSVYRGPDDAWGLELWHRPPDDDMVERSLAIYDAFYSHIEQTCRQIIESRGRVVVLDLHSYNHRRRGPGQPPDDPEENPEINVGTGSLDRARWSRLVEVFMGTLARRELRGKALDVRENVRFRGGYFSRWIHETFPERAACLAVEFKKIFVDEWTGDPDIGALGVIHEALGSAVDAIEHLLGDPGTGEYRAADPAAAEEVVEGATA